MSGADQISQADAEAIMGALRVGDGHKWPEIANLTPERSSKIELMMIAARRCRDADGKKTATRIDAYVVSEMLRALEDPDAYMREMDAEPPVIVTDPEALQLLAEARAERDRLKNAKAGDV